MHSAQLTEVWPQQLKNSFQKYKQNISSYLHFEGHFLMCDSEVWKERELEQPFSADLREKEKRREQVLTEFTNCPECCR